MHIQYSFAALLIQILHRKGGRRLVRQSEIISVKKQYSTIYEGRIYPYHVQYSIVNKTNA